MFGWLGVIGGWFKKVFSAAKDAVPAEVLSKAISLAEEAAVKYADNSDRREWVVQALIAEHVPESVARLAVELAVNFLKKQVS